MRTVFTYMNGGYMTLGLYIFLGINSSRGGHWLKMKANFNYMLKEELYRKLDLIQKWNRMCFKIMLVLQKIVRPRVLKETE